MAVKITSKQMKKTEFFHTFMTLLDQGNELSIPISYQALATQWVKRYKEMFDLGQRPVNKMPDFVLYFNHEAPEPPPTSQ